MKAQASTKQTWLALKNPFITFVKGIFFFRVFMLRFTIVICLLFVLHGAGWVVSGIFLKGAIQDWVQLQNNNGILISHDEPEARITGYPFSLNARLKDVIVAPEINNPNWYWRVDHLDVGITPIPFLHDTLIVEANTRHYIETKRQTFSGIPENFAASFNWTSSQFLPENVSLDISNWVLQDSLTRQKRLIENVDLKAQHLNNDQYGFDLKGGGIQLFYPVVGIGQQINEVLARGFVSHQDFLKSNNIPDLITWRDQGGVVEVERFKVRASSLDVQGNGILALDGDLQPVGDFTGRFQGFFQTVDRLARAGIISGPNASLAKVVLGALAKRPENGGPLTLSLPITLQDRGLYTGPVRLAEFPKINW